MRVLQLWLRLFVVVIVAHVAALIAVEAGAAPWMPAATTWAVISLGAAGAFVGVGVAIQVAALKRRLLRAVAARCNSVLVTPHDVVEQAFGPLVESGAVRNLAVAVILPRHPVITFPAADVQEQQTNLYEIGSLTKPMTAELLATMVLDGTVAMATPIGDVLSHPALPDDIAAIALEQLATHQSGLPRIPRTPQMALAMLFSADPYRWLSDPALLQCLGGARRTTPRGTYSNFGFAILGLVLGKLNGNGYRNALEAKLLRPLGLDNTYVDPDDEIALRRVRGHDRVGVPTPRWHTRAMAGGGGVSMTIADGAAWLAAHVDPPGAFQEVVAMVTRPSAPLGVDRVGMGWVVSEIDGRTVVWHNGGTGGFSSFAAFDPTSRVGVIAFAASSHISALDRAGFRVVRECTARWARHGAPAASHSAAP